MKMVFVVFNEGIEAEVMEGLATCHVESYTKLDKVHGVGKLSGPHMGTHIWPASNTLLMIGCEDNTKDQILEAVRKLRGAFPREGVKAFVLPMEEME